MKSSARNSLKRLTSLNWSEWKKSLLSCSRITRSSACCMVSFISLVPSPCGSALDAGVVIAEIQNGMLLPNSIALVPARVAGRHGHDRHSSGNSGRPAYHLLGYRWPSQPKGENSTQGGPG